VIATGAQQLGMQLARMVSIPTQGPAPMLDSLKLRTSARRKAGELYGAVVTQARRAEFYAALGVPDTPNGRYEMVVLHLFLVLERLREEGETPLPRLLVEAFIADMDDSLRELATGDLSVPKKVRRAATGLYERSMAYRAALTSGEESALADALSEHLYEGGDGAANGSRGALALAGYVRNALRSLAACNVATILDGRVAFPIPPQNIAEIQ
jgi:cytochrome b pre-mRNA-processing protein 3